ncbi:MAG: excinuclease ABC subunit UvrC [Verrucomicrobia bacterium]|nr:excinuclease ABC subunit UvrC [Verrucomicrobiota bacterium]
MELSSKIKQKLQALPDKPGVYFMRDRRGRIIYVGKAASLRHRVQSYFRQATLRSAEPKLRGLIRSLDDFDILVTRTEAEAVLTEGRLIKDYRPRYNVLMKDDKRFLLMRVNLNEPFPRFESCRLQKDDGATYFGPYASSPAVYAALEFIERRFGLRQCRPRVPGPEDHKHCHNDIVRYCSAPCILKVSKEQYRECVETALAFLRGERPEFLREMQQDMEKAAADFKFEKAAALRDTWLLLRRAIRERARGRKTLVLKAEEARAGLEDLRRELGLAAPPRVIECFDISNISGTHAVGSMVCAVDGLPQPNRYRMFRIRTVEGSDDPAMMAEVIRRRYGRVLAEQGARPDLVLVDGGITQLRAARAVLDELGLAGLPTAGLAKRFEEIYADVRPRATPLRLPLASPALRVLQQIRDEAHRFALTYHRRLRLRRIRESVLDEIEGVGANRKQALLKQFGSVRRLRRAPVGEIAAVPGIGRALARLIHEALEDGGSRSDITGGTPVSP